MPAPKGPQKDVPPPSENVDAATRASYELLLLLRDLFTALDISQETFAERADVSVGTVSNYLNRYDRPRSRTEFAKILSALKPGRLQRRESVQLYALTHVADIKRKAAELAQWKTAARTAQFDAYLLSEFTPVLAEIHTAIGRHQPAGFNVGAESYELRLPTYVPREYDPMLRDRIDRAVAGELRGIILLQGPSSTGKTRSLYEAVQSLGDHWHVLIPRTANAVRALPSLKPLLDRPSVLWLNELQRFLASSDQGLTVHLMEDLYAATVAPLVIVATIWPDKRPKPSDDHNTLATALLKPERGWTHTLNIPARFSDAERQRAHNLAIHDPRLARALLDPDHNGFTQTLAGAGELLDFYQTAATATRLLLDAAADARRLGNHQLLTENLLREMTLTLWRTDRQNIAPPGGDWWKSTLETATTPLRNSDGVRALVPLLDPDSTDGTIAGYTLADYLEQHLDRARRLNHVPDGHWNALYQNTNTADALIELAATADRYSRFSHSESFLRKAARTGNATALGALASWLIEQPGREHEAEQIYRDSIAAGNPHAGLTLAGWLSQQPGREHEAEQIYRDSIAAGNNDAMHGLVGMLIEQPGREGEIEQLYRNSIAAGNENAILMLAHWLIKQPGREGEGEQIYRDSIAAGNTDAIGELTLWLSRQPDRENEVEQLYRDSIAAGRTDAILMLAELLSRQPGRQSKVEQLYRDSMDVGNPDAMLTLAIWLGARAQTMAEVRGLDASEYPGRDEAENLFRASIAAGRTDAIAALALWLRHQPGRENEVEQLYRDSMDVGNPDAELMLAELLSRQPGRENEAEQLYRNSIAAGRTKASLGLADWLSRQPGRENEVEQIYREGIAAGNVRAIYALAEWLEHQPGRENEVEQHYRDGMAHSADEAMRALADWLSRQPGRENEVEQLYRDIMAAGTDDAILPMLVWLDRQPDRKDEAKRIRVNGVDARGRTI